MRLYLSRGRAGGIPGTVVRPGGAHCALATRRKPVENGARQFSFFVLFPVAPDGATELSRLGGFRKLETIEDEFVSLLQRHGIAYDPRYVWD